MRWFTVDLEGDRYRVAVVSDRYSSNDRLALFLVSENGEDFADITVNLPRAPCPPDCGYLDTNNSPWLESFVTDNGLGEPTGTMGFSGFCSYPQYRFDLELIESLQEVSSMSLKSRFKRLCRKRIPKDSPSDYVFGCGHEFHGCYLFDDGTFGYIGDPDFDPEEFAYGDSVYVNDELYISGKHAIGNLYIDRWTKSGEFIQGGCFLYFDGETMRDYCDRNGEPHPVKRIPCEVIEAFESRDQKALKRLRWKVRALKGVKLM